MNQGPNILKEVFSVLGKSEQIDNQRVLLIKGIKFATGFPFCVGLACGYFKAWMMMKIAFGLTLALPVIGLLMIFWLIIHKPHHFPGPKDFSSEHTTNEKQVEQLGKVMKMQIPNKSKPRLFYNEIYFKKTVFKKIKVERRHFELREDVIFDVEVFNGENEQIISEDFTRDSTMNSSITNNTINTNKTFENLKFHLICLN